MIDYEQYKKLDEFQVRNFIGKKSDGLIVERIILICLWQMH